MAPWQPSKVLHLKPIHHRLALFSARSSTFRLRESPRLSPTRALRHSRLLDNSISTSDSLFRRHAVAVVATFCLLSSPGTPCATTPIVQLRHMSLSQQELLRRSEAFAGKCEWACIRRLHIHGSIAFVQLHHFKRKSLDKYSFPPLGTTRLWFNEIQLMDVMDEK